MSNKRKVLVIDDSSTVRREVANALAGAGFEVLEAGDGIDGAAAIDNMPDISLVICDVNMPRMGGLEMLSRVKSDARNASLPIVMLTTEGQPALMRRAKDAGARGWIVKPFKPTQLVAAVQRLAG
jgi:two-component system chemotaxis response regulator CheY